MTTEQSPLVWITGGASGIGAALARRYLKLGHRVVISGRSTARLEQFRQAHPGVGLLPLDQSDAESCELCCTRLLSEFGVPDRIILNAGDHQAMPLAEFSSQTCERLMAVNFFGVTRILSHLLPSLRERGSGQIIIIASLAGYRGLPTAAAYGASKAALINFSEALYLDLNGTGIDLKLVNPGFVKTPLTDRNQFTMPSLVTPEFAAQQIIAGVQTDRFEIRFPRGFAWLMAILSLLPYRLYFWLIRRKTGEC